MPDFDDLRSEFESQPGVADERMSEIAMLVRERSDGLNSVLDKRDKTELNATIFVGVGYSIGAIFFPHPLSRCGALLAVLGCIEIAVLMKLARKPADLSYMSLSLGDYLAHEIVMIKRQIALLRHVAWWYIAPLYLGACLFIAGMGSHWFTAIFAVGYFFVCYRIWQANQDARQNNLEPLRDRLVAARKLVLTPEAPNAVYDEAIRGLSADTFDQPTPSGGLTPEQATQHGMDTLRAVGRFFDAIIVLVFMAWGGMVAGGMIDAVIDGKHPNEGGDGVFALIGFFVAAAYSLWTKPVNWSLLWRGVPVPNQESSDDAESSQQSQAKDARGKTF